MADESRVKFKCEHCGKRIGVPSKYAGRRVKCPGCEAPITVPEPVLVGAGASTGPAGDAVDQLAALAAESPSAPVSSGLRQIEDPAESSPAKQGAKTCPKCGVNVNPSAKICVECGHGFGGLNAKSRVRAQKTAFFAGRSGIAILGGIFAALAAGFLWAAVCRYTGAEIRILAVLLGIGVGVVVAVVARGQNDFVGLGAAVVALLGWGVAKVLILYWAIPGIAASEVHELGTIGMDMYREDVAVVEMHEAGELDDAVFNAWNEGELDAAGYLQIESQIDDWLAVNEVSGDGAGELPSLAKIEAEIRNEIRQKPLYNALWDYQAIEAIDMLWIALMVGSAWKVGSGVGFTSD